MFCSLNTCLLLDMFVIRMRFNTEEVPVPKNGMILFSCTKFHHGPASDGKNVINRFFFNLESSKTAIFRKARRKDGKRKRQVEVVQVSDNIEETNSCAFVQTFDWYDIMSDHHFAV